MMNTAARVFAHIPGGDAAAFAWQLNSILLVAGLATLAGGLLVLLFTRWGQARPLAKCVALSVFAHLLLLIAACGIGLFHEVPPHPVEHVIQLSLVDTGDLPSLSDPSDPVPPPEESRAEPPPGQSTPHLADAPTPSASDFTDDSQPPHVPDEPLPSVEASDAAAEVALTDAAPALLARPLAEAPAPAEPDLAPTPFAVTPHDAPSAEPPRLPLVESEPAPTFRISSRASPTTIAPGGDLQRLIDLALPVPSPDALADVRDQTAAARNGEDAAVEGETDGQTVSADGWLTVTASGGAEWRIAGLPATARRHELPDRYRNRCASRRQATLEAHGGNFLTEAAVQAALRWLTNNQSEDGRWNCSLHGGGREMRTLGHDRGGAGAEADTGVTGLAVLAFLGAGETHVDGPRAATVRRGLEFLARNQAADGNLAGSADLFARMYCHGIAAMALGEAYGMTGDAALRPYLERALAYTVRTQHPHTGGWRYQPGDEGDTSQLGWQLMALQSGELAGLPIPAATRAGMIRFLNSVAAGPRQGLASYRPRSGPTRPMTAEALACRLFLDVNQDEAAVREAVAYLLQETPQGGPFNEYYWYYATMALFQLQGDAWDAWNGALQERLLASQETTGTLAGSWPTDTVWGGYGGRVYTTAMNALCLEVYYRHLPLYGRLQPRPGPASG